MAGTFDRRMFGPDQTVAPNEVNTLMSTHVLNNAGKRLEKPALAECAMSLASTLLLGCQARGKLESSDDERPSTTTRDAGKRDPREPGLAARKKLAAYR